MNLHLGGGVRISRSKGLQGFTLAEVLITLGIIGVVAALTLPALIQNYQKQVYVNALKKSVSTLENGFKMALAEDGVDELRHTELFKSLSGGAYNENTPNDEFENNLKKYFNIQAIEKETKAKGYKFLNGQDTPFGREIKREILFSDGSSIVFVSGGPNTTGFSSGGCGVAVDINS